MYPGYDLLAEPDRVLVGEAPVARRVPAGHDRVSQRLVDRVKLGDYFSARCTTQ